MPSVEYVFLSTEHTEHTECSVYHLSYICGSTFKVNVDMQYYLLFIEDILQRQSKYYFSGKVSLSSLKMGVI